MRKVFAFLNIFMVLILLGAIFIYFFVPKEVLFKRKQDDIQQEQMDSIKKEELPTEDSTISVTIVEPEETSVEPEKKETSLSSSEYANFERIIDRIIEKTSQENP